MKAVLTITDTEIPDFTGLTLDLPEIPTPGFVGGLLAKALQGKEVKASLIVGETSPGELSETISIDASIPFLPAFMKSITEQQSVPALVGAAVKAIAPNGFDLEGSITFTS